VPDREDLRTACRDLALKLEGEPQWPALKAAYLDLATLVGRLQGAVSEAARTQGPNDELRAAEAGLETLKATTRQVGLDIRLASERALAVGLRMALESAAEVLNALDRAESVNL
jgi:hypothetical protein